ncbi:hypothetical protein ACFQ8E_14915 [Isoptericola sp. NPDC056573]|uniref:hypothetical protein n=1 Tax=Isoptericola sp. NPDC056573 TaxID=3345868 RepID=UPI0036A77594
MAARAPRHVTAAAGALLATLLATALGGCSGTPRVSTPGGDGDGILAEIGVSDVADGEVHTIMVAEVCLRDSSGGTVTAVVPDPGSGLVVRRFTVGQPADPSNGVGGAEGTLDENGLGAIAHDVLAVCDEDPPDQVHVEVTRTSPAAYSAQLTLDFVADGRRGELTNHVSLTMCAPDATEPRCASGG